MKFILPCYVNYVLNKITKSGFEAYIVGGCVRDMLLLKKPKDFDITTNAKPSDIKKIFKKTYDTGILHGTVTVIYKDKKIEVTTYRLDGEYIDNRRPESVFYTNDIKDDLKRRDFTINAMAYNNQMGIIDLFGGKTDIQKKLIKCVLNPKQRFLEDALRMLRAVRFSAVLDFEIEKNTEKAIINCCHLIKNVSIERIKDELRLIILSKNIKGIKNLQRLGLLTHISKDLDNIVLNFKYENAFIKSQNDIIFKLCILFADISIETAIKILKYLKFDNKTIKKTEIILKFLKYEIMPCKISIKKLLSNVPNDIFLIIIKLKGLIYNLKTKKIIDLYKEIIKNEEAYTIKMLMLDGNQLIKMGFKGKEIKNIQNYLLDLIIKSPELNNYNDLISAIKNFGGNLL